MATRGKDAGSSSGQFPRRRIYMCNHCPCYFFSRQALSGHQNAHRPWPRPRRATVFVQVPLPPPVPAPLPPPPVPAPLPVLVQVPPPVPAPWAEGTGDNFSQSVVHNPSPIGAQGYGIPNWGMNIPNADDEASSTTGEEYSDLDLELRL